MTYSSSLASENYAGVHPELIEALIRANTGHSPSYGNDDYTRRALEAFRECFGANVNVHFTFNGTGANVFALSAMTRRYDAVLCSETAHVQVHESTALEAFTGCRLIIVPSENGKIIPSSLEKKIKGIGDPHSPQPRVLSITQPTELGTIYNRGELSQLISIAHGHGLSVHVDGARFFNAAAALECSLQEITSGIDVLSLGGTKSGMMFGEAVVFFNADIFGNSQFLLKRSMQLASKMRFISCQFEAMLREDLWKRIATHSNAMARYLAEQISSCAGISVTRPVETNTVFASFPREWNEILQRVLPFYVWNQEINEVRMVCSFDTTREAIDLFAAAARQINSAPETSPMPDMALAGLS